jgi:endonuclease/exonuclease/phosphatase (EEP) superfamily protein YafD
MMTRLNLQAATSYYQHKKYWTWHDHRLGRHHQLDHFLMDGRLGERIYDAKRLIGGAESDHLPIKPFRTKNLKVKDS